MPGPLSEAIPLEGRLLVLLLRGETGGDLPPLLESASQEVLDEVAGSAFRQGVSGLLYIRLRQTGRLELFSPEWAARLQARYLHSAAFFTRLSYDFEHALRLLRNEGIEVIVLKGMHLAAEVFSDPAGREMCDIDLLVRRKDIVRAGNLLISNGFGSPDYHPSDATCEWVHQLKPLVNARGSSVELHWTLSMAGPNRAMDIDLDGLWERSEAIRFRTVEARVLSAEDLLLHLALHLTVVHRFDVRLRGMYDLHAVVTHYTEALYWDAMLERAAEWKVQKNVLFVLSLAAELFDTPLPDLICMRLESPETAPMQQLALETVFSESMDGNLKTMPLIQLLKTGGVIPTLTAGFRKLFYPAEFILSMYNLPPDTPVWKLYILRTGKILSVLFSNLRQLSAPQTPRLKESFALERNIDRIMEWLKD